MMEQHETDRADAQKMRAALLFAGLYPSHYPKANDPRLATYRRGIRENLTKLDPVDVMIVHEVVRLLIANPGSPSLWQLAQLFNGQAELMEREDEPNGT